MRLSIISISCTISMALGLMYRTFELSKLVLLAALLVMAIGVVIAQMKSKSEIEERAT